MKLSEFLRARRTYHRNRFPYPPPAEADITALVNRDRAAAEFAGVEWDDELPTLCVNLVGTIGPAVVGAAPCQPLTGAQKDEIVRRCNVHGDVRAFVDRLMPDADLRGELLAILDRGLAGLDE